VVSVTAEGLGNASFQSAPVRPARPDSNPAPASSDFAALVDGNTAPSDSYYAQASSASAPAAPPRADDPPPAPDTTPRVRNADPASTVRSDSGNRDTSPQCGDGSNSTANATDVTTSKSAKPAPAKPSKPSSDDNASAKDVSQTKVDGVTTFVNSLVPIAMSAAAAQPTTAPAVPPAATDKNAAPPATAAAAITAAAPITTGTSITASASINRAASINGAATVVTGADATAVASANLAKTATTQVVTHDAVTDAENPQAGTTDAITPTRIALAASVTAATPAAGKTVATPKPSPKDGTATASEQNGAADNSDAATTTPAAIVPDSAQLTAAAGKQKPETSPVDLVQADASSNLVQTPAAKASGHGQGTPVDATQKLLPPTDNGAQAATVIQPQQPPTVPATTPASAQLNVTAATHGSVPVNGLAVEIAASAKSGKTRFEIRLDPPELGRIDVRIHVDRDGQVTSHLTVERPETLSMLRQDATQLQRALDNAGLSTGDAGLQFSLRDQSSSGQNNGNQSNPNAHRLIITEDDNVPAAAAGRSYGRMLGASGGVDIRV
jgi:flagellar hook-length control protein FliK